ncbi:MAG: thioesterase [Eubacteriales bacterium]
MIKYSKNFLITFRDTDCNGNLKVTALVDFMQDIARIDASSLGVNFESPDVTYYWIISRSKINILHTPKIDETIRIETHHSGMDKLFAVREFQIYDQNNLQIGDITGYYVLMSTGTTWPVKIKKNPEFSGIDFPYTGKKVEKLVPLKENLEKSLKRRVFSSDIDGNGHMNNAHYVRWCFDMYETSELNMRKVKSFQIQYVKELLENDEITINRYDSGYIVGESDETVYFIGKIAF